LCFAKISGANGSPKNPESVGWSVSPETFEADGLTVSMLFVLFVLFGRAVCIVDIAVVICEG
jgi:hypothetical protein